MFDCLFNEFLVPLEKDLHVAVRKISHPPIETKAVCHITGKSPVKDTLHNTTDDEMSTCLLHIVIIAKLDLFPQIRLLDLLIAE